MKKEKTPVAITIRHVPLCEGECEYCDAYRASDRSSDVRIPPQEIRRLKGILISVASIRMTHNLHVKMQEEIEKVLKAVPELRGGKAWRYDL